MRKLYKQAEKLLKLIDTFEKDQVNDAGKMTRSKEAIEKLDYIIKYGLDFYNKLVEAKCYENHIALEAVMHGVREYASKIEINDMNAKKLTLENSIEIWQQLEVALALLADTFLQTFPNEGN